jgi:hypothetical protein
MAYLGWDARPSEASPDDASTLFVEEEDQRT